MRIRGVFWLFLVMLFACGDDDGSDTDAGTDAGVADVQEDADVDPGEAAVRFELGGANDTPETFFDAPWPSDLRLRDDGTPNLAGYPDPFDLDLLAGLFAIADQRPGYPTIPVASFRFTAPIAPAVFDEVISADVGSRALLIDIDSDSPDRGQLIPTVAITHARDLYTGDNLVSVAPRPGFILHAGRTYGVVILRSWNDSRGRPLLVDETLAMLAAGETPSGAEDAAALYAPLFETLDTLSVPRTDVAAATVFTTGDVVEDLYDLSSRVVEAEDITVDGLRFDPAGDHERYCEVVGEIRFPQYQRGTPPFNTEGTFEFGSDGLPIEQRLEVARIHLTLPKQPMPAEGYPLMMYFHGSGGVASQVVDRGPARPTGSPVIGEGPAHVVAAHGFASVGASLPLSPDRLPGASAIEYLNLENLAAFRDTFRQGVIEQRLLIEALQSIEINPAALGGCTGPELPDGETMYRFNADEFVALGQSMGGMYTNMIGAVEPSLKALVPTGAGGHWSFFILETDLIAGARELLALVLRVGDAQNLTFMHPAMHLLAVAWEPAEPMVYMPRLSRRPLPEIPIRPIYEPVGINDSFFPIEVYDAMALAYGHPQAGENVWPSMQDALGLGGLEGFVDYPVRNNLMNDRGESYTGAVVQYPADDFDGHVIFVELDDVKYQYGCFLRTAIDTGVGVVPEPAPFGTPCPTE
ncbi:MAG: hypothetical protein AAGE52_29605 [Myxococcota bacterium]